MRQVVITRHGGPEVLKVREAPDPHAGPGELRVRVAAAGINFADLMARMGLYPEAPKPPCVVGYEVCGVIDEVGAGVTNFTVGERVFGMSRFGGYSDLVLLPVAQTFKMPDAMTFEQGAALPVVSITAHHMMLGLGNLRRGSRILIHSAAGGVGVAAVQIAKTRECEVLGVASAGKHDFLRSIGVQHCLDASANLTEQVRAIVGGPGRDLGLDPGGGILGVGVSAGGGRPAGEPPGGRRGFLRGAKVESHAADGAQPHGRWHQHAHAHVRARLAAPAVREPARDVRSR